MTEPVTVNLAILARDLDLPSEHVETVVELLDQGAPIPFIARYRKDVTGNLDEDHLRAIAARLREQRLLAERKETILRSVGSIGKLTPELEKKIRQAWTSRRLEDLYLPYKPRKQTLAALARERGLQPLADEILNETPIDLKARAADFINSEKGVNNADEALLGAGHIISESFNERLELRHKIREIIERTGKIISKKIEAKKEAESKTEDALPPQSSGDNPVVPEAAVSDSAVIKSVEENLTETAAENAQTPASETAAENAQAPASESAAENAQDSASETAAENAQTPAAESAAENAQDSAAESAAENAQTPAAESAAENAQALASETAAENAQAPAAESAAIVKSQASGVKESKSKKKSKKKSAAEQRLEQQEKLYSDYFDFKADIRNCPPYRILAVNRGEREKVLRVRLEVNEERVREAGLETVVPEEHPQKEFLTGCLNDAVTRFLLPSLEREIRRELTERAEKQGIRVFAKNLRNLLLQKPLFRRRVLALDPGFRYGCKLVALDEFGNYLGYETVYITGSVERRGRAIAKIADLIEKYKISIIAIGNGTGCREAEDIVAKMISDRFADREMAYIIVNEAGASVYSVSPTAKEEFPNYDAMMRGAVSIGRRLQDPLNELVKIDPASLGVGIYQHDLKTKHLKESLAEVVESAVNYVGVDLNCATSAILKYVAGLNQLTAKRIFEYRMEHGPFRYREELKKVPGFGEAAFTHSAGFLKISDGYEPFDATWIHPESYPLAEKILDKIGFLKENLKLPEKRKELAEKLESLDAESLAEEFSAGRMTVTDILDQLKRPGRDPRESLPAPIFKKGVMKMENLVPGMELMGTVLNVVDFGAFVDIGLHDSGLIHISRMGDRFVRDAHQRLAVGDVVKVWVVEIDQKRHRISLSMLPPGTERKTGQRGPKSNEEGDGGEGRRERNSRSKPVPAAVEGGSVATADRASSEGGRPERRDDRRRSHGRSDDRNDRREDRGGERNSNRENDRRDDRNSDRRERSNFGNSERRSRRSERGAGGSSRPSDRGDRRGGRFDSGKFPRVMTFESKLEKVDSLSEEMKQGKEPLRSFGDLARLLSGPEPTDKKTETKSVKTISPEKKDRKAPKENVDDNRSESDPESEQNDKKVG